MTAQTKSVTLGLIQQSHQGGPDANLDHASAAIAAAAARGAQVICLQELFRSHYPCQEEDYDQFDLAESIPGPSTERLSALAREHEVVIVASLFEERAPGLYHNTAAVIDADGTLLGRYRKMHIPDDPGYYEKFYFTPGDLGFRAFDTRYARIGVLICWDQWYPEAARLTALQGAEVIFYPTAIGWHDSQSEEENRAQHDAWEVSMRGHSVANGVYVAAVNRTGREGPVAFWGQSFVTDTFGGVLERGPQDEEATLVCELDLTRIRQSRQHWPFLRDRRIDAYGGLTQRFADAGDSSP
ncbi:MAG: carbon-nitrogen hydrolase [Planctomycetota bacterium]|jgi:N-carbamoylputrescine amidase